MSWTARLLLGAALAAAFTACVVHHSQRYSRLLSPPQYDDVAYFADAAQRLVILEQNHVGACVEHLISSPPHSPLSTSLALAGFLVFGIHDWAPYAANGILVFALLWMVEYLFRGRSLAVRGAMALLVLALPWTSMLVYLFKPDPPCALMMGFAVALAFEEDLVRATRQRRCAVGAVFGLALFFKPSFFIFVIALTAATFAGTMLTGPSRFRETLRAWVLVVVAMIAVGGLPLALQPRYYVRYLLQGLFEPPIPSHAGGWREQALYYLTGNPDYLMSGQQLALLSAAFLASAATLAYRQSRDRLRLLLAQLVPVAAAYLLPTLSSVKHPDFGVMFGVLLSFAVLRGLAELGGRSGAALTLAVTLVGLWFAKPPPQWGSASSHWLTERRRIVDEVYTAVRERVDRPGMRIFVTAVGSVSPDLLRFYCIRDGLPFLEARGVPLPEAHRVGSNSPDPFGETIEWADLVIAPAPGAAEVWPYTPGARHAGESLAAVRANASFSLFRKVETEGGAYYLFEKRGPFYGFRDAQGLQEAEGPYPQWNLGIVRWGLGPETTLRVENEQAGHYRLSLDGRSALPELEIAILLDDQVIARHTFKDASRFEKLEVPVDLPAGGHTLRITYSRWMQPPIEPRRLALLFNSLRLVPDKASAPQS